MGVDISNFLFEDLVESGVSCVSRWGKIALGRRDLFCDDDLMKNLGGKVATCRVNQLDGKVLKVISGGILVSISIKQGSCFVVGWVGGKLDILRFHARGGK